MTTATKTALGQVRSLGQVPKLIATHTKSGLAKDVVTYPIGEVGYPPPPATAPVQARPTAPPMPELQWNLRRTGSPPRRSAPKHGGDRGRVLAPTVYGAAAHLAVLRVVIGQGPVVRAALVPNCDITFLPSPPNLQIRFSTPCFEPREKPVALGRFHADDGFHEVAAYIQHGAACHGVFADERVHHPGERLSEFRDVKGTASFNPLPQVISRTVTNLQGGKHRLHCGGQLVPGAVEVGPQRVTPELGITKAARIATIGGSPTQVMSVCQRSASGGLSAVSSITWRYSVPPKCFIRGYTVGVPNLPARLR